MDEQPIRLTLPAETLYVSGTVNGVAVTWTNVEGNDWQAIAARAANDVYLVELTIIDGQGQPTETSITLYYGLLNLITDRSAADVIRYQQLRAIEYEDMTAAEKAEWDGPLKGSYDYLDLNRVGAAEVYVAGELEEAGYRVIVSPKTDWIRGAVPTPAQYAQYLADIAAIRSALSLADIVPTAPTKVTERTDANDIETILLAVDDALRRAREATIYLNTIYCGMTYYQGGTV